LKQLALLIANTLGLIWRMFPKIIRTGFITGLFVLDSRHGDASKGLSRLLLLRDKLDWVINERAMVYGHGEHPKHRLTDYHRFFVQHINDGERVLDVGCGYGAVARSIARAYPRCIVMGMDQEKSRLAQAQVSDNPNNLQFVVGDATKEVPLGPWNAVVLSNVLEHIEERVNFLAELQKATQASRYLIRVPLFERDWQMALRRELGVNFRSDDDHKIEHTLAKFRSEIFEAGLKPVELQTIWGEIWADCRPVGEDAC